MRSKWAFFALSLFAFTLAVSHPAGAGGSGREPVSDEPDRVEPAAASTAVRLRALTRADDDMALALGPPAPPPPPAWFCPVHGDVSFVDSWGDRRSGGRRHKGVDMMSALGTPVVAPVAGTVTYRGSSVGGMSFHLDGVDGVYYYGTHLSAYGDVEGAVGAGTVIGYVGGTGNARGNPHLHFEIHPGGQGNAVDPYPTVAEHCANAEGTETT